MTESKLTKKLSSIPRSMVAEAELRCPRLAWLAFLGCVDAPARRAVAEVQQHL
jgi:hypothetical protein